MVQAAAHSRLDQGREFLAAIADQFAGSKTTAFLTPILLNTARNARATASAPSSWSAGIKGGQDGGDPAQDTDPGLGTWQELHDAIAQIQAKGVKMILFAKLNWADLTTAWYTNELYKYACTDPYGIPYRAGWLQLFHADATGRHQHPSPGDDGFSLSGLSRHRHQGISENTGAWFRRLALG